MSRGKAAPKRVILADPKFGSILLAKFINYAMFDGKKTITQRFVYGALDILAEKQNHKLKFVQNVLVVQTTKYLCQ